MNHKSRLILMIALPILVLGSIGFGIYYFLSGAYAYSSFFYTIQGSGFTLSPDQKTVYFKAWFARSNWSPYWGYFDCRQSRLYSEPTNTPLIHIAKGGSTHTKIYTIDSTFSRSQYPSRGSVFCQGFFSLSTTQWKPVRVATATFYYPNVAPVKLTPTQKPQQAPNVWSGAPVSFSAYFSPNVIQTSSTARIMLGESSQGTLPDAALATCTVAGRTYTSLLTFNGAFHNEIVTVPLVGASIHPGGPILYQAKYPLYCSLKDNSSGALISANKYYDTITVNP